MRLTSSHQFNVKEWTRDWILELMNELLTFRLNWAGKDPSYNLPKGLLFITVQEMAVLKKCLKTKPMCWGPDA